MTITTIQAKNIELTEAIRLYVEEKVILLEKLTHGFEPVAKLAVEVGKTSHHHAKGEVFRAEMNLQIPGKMLRAEEVREDLYEAIDMAKDELKRQLTDHKERLLDQHREPRPGKE